MNHRNIIRYFDAWDETPPPGWQENQDNIARMLSSSANQENDLDSEMDSSFDSRQLSDRFADLYAHSDSSSFIQCNVNRVNREYVEGESSSSELIAGSELNTSSLATNRGIHTYLYIQMELCREESLAKWLETRDPELNIYKVYREILKAVKYLHEQVCVPQKESLNSPNYSYISFRD